MRKLLLALFVLTISVPSFAQITDPTTTDKTVQKVIDRAGDHFMIQVAQNVWSGAADSIKNLTKSLNRSANVYLMINKKFKSDPRMSIGLGLGIGTSNMYFKKAIINIAGTSSTLNFTNAAAADHYKKYKVSTAYLQVPVEFRFTAHPENPNKSVKAALGLKVGTLLNAHTKGKILQNSAGTEISDRTDKVRSSSYFTGTDLAATARIGYGVFGLFGSYNLTSVFKSGVAPDMKLLQIGLTISGL